VTFNQQETSLSPPSSQDTVEDNIIGNTREIDSHATRITSLQQLLDYCKVDLKTWSIERHVINKWEVGRKAVTKSLKFNDGIIDGTLKDDGGINVEPLFQIKVWLVKRKPEAIKPVISPVYIKSKLAKLSERTRELKSALILPDPQFGFSRNIMNGELVPFHDRLALDVVLQISRVLHPDTIIYSGDVNDWSGWSDKFIRKPEFYFTTQPALIEASWYIRQTQQTAKKTIILEGNHDMRPEVMIMTHLVDAYGLRSADQLTESPVFSVDNLLGLTRMGVEYITGYPDVQYWLNSNTRVIHGEKVRGQPGQTAAAVVRDANENVIFGHIHRIERATKTVPTQDGYRTVTAYSPGCLCHVDGRVPGSKKSDQWQQGAAVVWYDEETTTIVPIDIYKGRAIYSGEIFQGVDYLDRLKTDTNWNF
jgi:metallophosphoesterase superfamily enzyme